MSKPVVMRPPTITRISPQRWVPLSISLFWQLLQTINARYFQLFGRLLAKDSSGRSGNLSQPHKTCFSRRDVQVCTHVKSPIKHSKLIYVLSGLFTMFVVSGIMSRCTTTFSSSSISTYSGFERASYPHPLIPSLKFSPNCSYHTNKRRKFYVSVLNIW